MAIWKLEKVETETGMKKTFIYDEMKKGTFPAAIRLSKRAVGWIDQEIIDWVQARIKASRAANA